MNGSKPEGLPSILKLHEDVHLARRKDLFPLTLTFSLGRGTSELGAAANRQRWSALQAELGSPSPQGRGRGEGEVAAVHDACRPKPGIVDPSSPLPEPEVSQNDYEE